jgi:repressor LexA
VAKTRQSSPAGATIETCTPAALNAIELETNERCFVLRVHGDSMRDAHIVDGDLVLMEFRPPAPGAIVAALIDGECVLKRYLTEGGRAYLRGESAAHAKLIPAEELVIQGVLKAVIRKTTL